jgi:hypothetical protein
MKKCIGCGIEKDILDFYKTKISIDGHQNYCKDCKRINDRKYKKKYNFKYRSENSQYLSDYNKKYRKENIDKIENYLLKNKDKINEKRRIYLKNKISSDELFRISKSIRNIIYKSYKRKGFSKKTNSILGCTFEEFKIYLESKFEPWMNWDNYGVYNGDLNYGWDIDHIIPISTAKTEEDIINLNHYSNLQPLCSKINRHIKGNKTKR